MDQVPQSALESVESLELALHNTKNAFLQALASDVDVTLSDRLNDVFSSLKSKLKSARRISHNVINVQNASLNKQDLKNREDVRLIDLIQQAHTMMLIFDLLSKWQQQKNNDVNKALHLIVSSISSPFQFLESDNHALSEDSTMMEILFWFLFEKDQSTTTDSTGSFFCSLINETKKFESIILNWQRIESQITATHDISNSRTALVSMIVQVTSTLQRQHNFCHQNHHSNNQQHRSKRRRVIQSDLNSNDTESKLWKIILTYCLARLAYNLVRLENGYAECHNNTSSNGKSKITIDELIYRIKSLTKFYDRLSNSMFETAGIAFFLLDLLLSPDPNFELSNFSLHSVTDFLCRYP